MIKNTESSNQPKRTLSWKEGIDPETEDRLEYLKLTSEEKWKYMMTLILSKFPADKQITFKKRIIEWK